MEKEKIYRTMLNIIGVMYSKTEMEEGQTFTSQYYEEAKDLLDDRQYNLFLIYALALIDKGGYIRFESKKLNEWAASIQALKEKNYTPKAIVGIMKEEI